MRLLDALGRNTAPSQTVTESRMTLDDYVQMMLQGGTYLTGPSGSKPDQIDTQFVSRIHQIHDRHGVIAAAVETRALLMSQVRFKYRRVDGSLYGTRDLLPLERPGSKTRPELLKAMEIDASYSGTAVIGRRGGELFRLAPDKVKFVLSSNSDPTWLGDNMIPPFDARVSGVIYDPGMSASGQRGLVETFAPGEFAVWAPEPDPIYFWRGTSWVTSVVREMLIDGQVTDHESKFFEKAATPGLVFMMDPSRTPEEIKAYSDVVNSKFAGVANSYKNMFLGGATDVKVVGSSMTDLGLNELQGTYENRVAVRSRIPAVILGSKESLSGSSLNAGNYSAARRMLADGWFTPTVDNLCAALEAIIPVPGDGSELSFDPSRILFLQEDQLDNAQIQNTQSSAMRQLIDGGFEPASVVEAVTTGDMTKLKHTGNVSVQLQPPGSGQGDRAETPQAEERQQSFAFNFPEQRFDIAIPQQSPPVVNVEAPIVNVPEQRMDMPAVTVENIVNPTPVTIDNQINVDPTPVNVDVRNDVETPIVNVNATAAAPTVNVQLPENKSRHRVMRDDAGRISEVIEA